MQTVKNEKLNVLTPQQQAFWNKNDFLVLDQYFSKKDLEQMLKWVKEIESWPIADDRHLNYYEQMDGENRLSRTENFLPFHPQFKKFLEEKGIFKMMEDIFGEPVVLFKEKINYKYPNTGEYPPHQDVHAYQTSPYAFQPYHRNLAIFLDDSDMENGCMELGWGYEKNKVFDKDATGTMKDYECAKLDWKPVEVKAGSIFIFDMFWPHRSAQNLSNRARRTIFLTFNGISKGDLREQHYKDRASGKAKSREIKSNLVVQTLIKDKLK